MQRWSGLILAATLIIAFILGLLVQPKDSRASLEKATWQASYFANTHLTGEMVLSRYERTINYNWAENAPLGVPHDEFSARWVGSFEFTEGLWRFLVGADDGVRLWVDNKLVIDEWVAGSQYNTYSADLILAEGVHELKVEFFEETGLAGITVRWDPVPIPPTETPEPPNVGSEGTPSPNEGTSTVIDAIGHVATSRLNIYQGPGIQYLRIGQVYLYQKFTILGKNSDGTWYLLDLKNAQQGWVQGNYLYRTGDAEILVQPVKTDSSFISKQGLTLEVVRLRNSPRVRAETLDILPVNTEVTVLGRSVNSLWYLIQIESVRGWVFAPSLDIPNVVLSDIPFVQP